MRTCSVCLLLLLTGTTPAIAASRDGDNAALANRLTWGVSSQSLGGPQPGSAAWLDAQLKHPDDTLPPAIAAQIAAMRISRTPVAQLVVDADAANRYAGKLPDVARRDAARTAYQRDMTALANEAAARSLLRDNYAPDQLREQMTWFWMNHFSVQAQKRDIRAMVGDYEETVRDHAFGKFRDLLEATLKHPAMLRYLDNDQNAAGHINENYAREIMELHSMGVGTDYTQKDVQELARILTGVGVDLSPTAPKLNPQRQALYLRAGLFEFNPNRHDFGDKQFLGQTIKGSGFGEVETALDLIARAPATAHHVSLQLATYFLGDRPPPAVIDRMTAAWRKTDGDIAAVLRAMIRAPEFRRSPGTRFKDPVQYTVSAVRLMYGDRTILNPQPILGWLNRMGEGLYARETPDGFPLESAAWTSPGQMSVRFEIARQIGSGANALFKPPPPPAATVAPGTMPAVVPAALPLPPVAVLPAPPLPHLQTAAYYTAIAPRVAWPTKAALAQATAPQQWNALFLSSPDFMRR
ncbi:DUF1800 domain-containing protein [Sphingomonas glacialis]|uniref:DUF1800 domain-containing protein n=1 Tax=Sphingomonas glacialis TaxID=658225 RepID=A0A502FHW7_9SPHN|nr:DUF1800 domain-containing protein [Sphingomonas glacialis]TPG49060.1 DUF1800 domain-containing protein [Sphingomonas glacialis]